ncbi:MULTISPECIES: histone deacetylase family protein [Acidianus]|uniref:Deacetylase n=1 Tax=Candidatus Acidianus copahuensis TaxID=1160895 RepID=A0A031LTP2_9CREN|nr:MULTISPECIES: histone deacetylase family protein [Acidianus]EZQ10874.1 deacetylase [Candidatus Acidianus copahuensis]NON62022.1 histone deacetylase family protein [Acidianus sp. RZ1]
MFIVLSKKHELHYPPSLHHENPDRIRISLDAIKDLGKLVEPDPAQNVLVHSPEYVERVKRTNGWLDADTYVNTNTYIAALYALGGAELAVRLGGIALVRPPGHHSGTNGKALGAPTQGFCIFNNVAYAIKKLGLKNVAVIDFDVHYGNGTQEIFYRDPEVLHIDIHQDPGTLYPGTGFPEMIGEGEGRGTKVNLIVPPLSRDDIYLELIPIVESILDDYKPSTLIFSAGFDAYVEDGLSSVMATEKTFYSFGRLNYPSKSAVLEGGYSEGLRRGLRAFAEGFSNLEKDYPITYSTDSVKTRFLQYLGKERKILRDYWKV